MIIKRTINLLLCALMLVTTVLGEPLGLLSVQAAKVTEQEVIIEDGDAEQGSSEDIIESDDLDGEGEVEMTPSPDTDTDGATDIGEGDDEPPVFGRGPGRDIIPGGGGNEEEPPIDDENYDELVEGEARAPGDVVINTGNFPSQSFQYYLYQNFDRNRDGVLSLEERNAVTWIDVSRRGITTLEGIEQFPKLVGLIAYSNSISSVDLSKNTELTTLSLSNNRLNGLNLSNNTKLTSLTLNDNSNLKTLALNNQTALKHLECRNNGLSTLNVSNNPLLTHLDFANNKIAGSINFNINTKLKVLDCTNNSITTLNLANNTELAVLECSNNQLTGLNINNNKKLSSLNCRNNSIPSLNLDKNTNLIQILAGNNILPELNIPIAIANRLEYLEYEYQRNNSMTPNTVRATASGRAINITWNSVSGATGYELYRYDNTYGNWERVAAREITGTSYSDTRVKQGENYRYKLYAFNKTSTAKQYMTYSITTSGVKTAVPTPARLKPKTKVANASRIDISWTRDNAFNGYEIHMATSKNGKYTRVGTVITVGTATTANFKHTGLKAGTTYYYKIRGYVQLGTSRLFSSYTPVVSRKQIVSKVENVKVANQSADSLRLAWNKVDNASGYEVYQATSKNGKYTRIATLNKSSSTAFTVKRLSPKRTYHYKVRAYRNVDKVKRNGKYSNVISKKVVLAKPTLTAKAKSRTAIDLSWKKVSGAKEYEIYRATSKNGKYKKIATTKARKFTNTKLKKNRNYFYRIKAVQRIGNKKHTSAFSAKKSARTKR